MTVPPLNNLWFKGGVKVKRREERSGGEEGRGQCFTVKREGLLSRCASERVHWPGLWHQASGAGWRKSPGMLV